MRDFRRQVAVLATLHELASEGERVAAFRQGMASLAQVAVDPAAAPFEGVDPEALRESVRLMLALDLFDALTFLSGSGSGSALYALASALPALAPERRELGRRVLSQLYQGDAESFIALATALALGAARAFEGPFMRGRLELTVLLPAGAGVCVDPLAFAVLSRRELCNRFLIEPATADLPARRLAARLLERAARYAALRAQQGDHGELASFDAPHVEALFAQLLGDREPLVFRHAASARGLLSTEVARHAEDIERDLTTTAPLSRARRGAISLAARLSTRPDETVARAAALLRGPLLARDPGLAAALIQGLVCAVEVEPEAAEQLLIDALTRGGLLAIEALLELRRELHGSHFCPRATDVAKQQLQQSYASAEDDSEQRELCGLLLDALSPQESALGSRLTEQISDALLVYARSGPLAALEPARAALETAARHVERLALLEDHQGRRTRRELFRLLSELELGLLDSCALAHLLAAGGAGHDAAQWSARLTSVLQQLLTLLTRQEQTPHGSAAPVPHLTLRMRRLRLLLHLLDADLRASDEQLAGLREQQLCAVRKLLERVSRDASSAMDRIVHASLARGAEALLRSETLELADVVLSLASFVPRPEGLLALADGCLHADLRRALRALCALTETLDQERAQQARWTVEALGKLAHAIPSDESPRTEALRRALLGLACALEALLAAHSVRELVRSRRALTLFEGAIIELAYLTRGARVRLGVPQEGVVIDESPVVGLSRALESAATQGEIADLGPNLEWLARELERTLPAPLASCIARVLENLRAFPLESSAGALLAPASFEACPLPAWLPASRRLGGYSVERPLGAGLASSVFLVKRSEERGDETARGLALKVPRYDARAARVLSAAEFEAAFARELPALLTVPPNEHLASFVSVETRPRPRPFLVMEWVEGPTLSRVRKRQLDATRVLDGLLAGLEVLHAMGIGHGDVSPSRVVLRMRAGEVHPVLVDFGFAGRHVRAGCGDAAYLAPELWHPEHAYEAISPAPVDIYAVGCLAYELLTGRPLFYAPTEGKVAAMHRAHDGALAALRELDRDPRTAPLAAWIPACLAPDPAQRGSATQLRKALRSL
jgi:eukaryotic-like serine/threonine-protein kinase